MAQAKTTGKPHDDLVCGIDPEQDCDRCRPQTIRRNKLLHLQDRLGELGIGMEELADLLWMHLEDGLARTVQGVAREEIRRLLLGVRLNATIDGTNFRRDGRCG